MLSTPRMEDFVDDVNDDGIDVDGNVSAKSTTPQSWHKVIEPGINAIFGLQKCKKDWFTPAVYMELYSTIFNHSSSSSSSPSSSNSAINGGDLYLLLEQHLIKTIFPHFLRKINKNTSKYLIYWKDFVESSSKIEAIFHYLDRYWISGNKKHIYPLLWEGWYQEVLQRINNPPLPSDWMGEEYFLSLIELSYVPEKSLLLKNVPKTSRYIYRERESPFHSFVRREYLLNLLNVKKIEPPLTSNLDKMEEALMFCEETISSFKDLLPQMERITYEEEIIAAEECVKDWIVEIIIIPMYDLICQSRMDLLNHGVVISLLSYKASLFSSSDWLDFVKKSFIHQLEHVIKEGSSDYLKISPHLQIPYIFFCEIFSSLKDGGGGDAFLLNMNVIEMCIGMFLKNFQDSKPSLSFKICDWLDSLDVDENDSVALHNNIRLLNILLKFLNSTSSKDTFKEEYSLSLSRRLLLLDFSVRKEEIIIKALSSLYGYAYTTPLTRMLKDINPNLKIQLLTIGPWPFGRKDNHHPIPAPPQGCIANFPPQIREELLTFSNNFSYQNKQNNCANKILSWSPMLSWSIVAVPLSDGRIVGVKMNLFQYEILLSIEKNVQMTYGDICLLLSHQLGKTDCQSSSSTLFFPIEEALRKMVQSSLLISKNDFFYLGNPSSLPKSIIPFSMGIIPSSSQQSSCGEKFKSPTIGSHPLSKESQFHSVQALLLSLLKRVNDDEGLSKDEAYKTLLTIVKVNPLYPNYTIDKKIFTSSLEALINKGYVEVVVERGGGGGSGGGGLLKYIP